MTELDPFIAAFRGGFYGVLRWEQLDRLWQGLKSSSEHAWYIYQVGEQPPREAVEGEQLHRFIDEVDQLLRREHDEDYCGIVYADDLENPSFIKIFDPGNLGVVCGYSDQPTLPGWTLSMLRPVDLPAAFPPPANRRRWWQRLFGS